MLNLGYFLRLMLSRSSTMASLCTNPSQRPFQSPHQISCKPPTTTSSFAPGRLILFPKAPRSFRVLSRDFQSIPSLGAFSTNIPPVEENLSVIVVR